MANEPRITVEGNVSWDPELRQTQNGKRVTGIKVLQTPRKKQGEQWADQPTLEFELTLWDDEAEYAVTSLPKGTSVLAIGRLTGVETYQSKGETRIKHKVAVENIGPSLRKATAQVTRRARGEQAPAQQQGVSWGAPAAQEAPAR